MDAATIDPAGSTNAPTLADLLQQALLQPAGAQRMQWLAQHSGCSPQLWLQQLATHCGLPHASDHTLAALHADFTRLGFADCQRRLCAVGHWQGQSTLTVVLADPLDNRLRQWLDWQLRGVAYDTLLAAPNAIETWLLRQEKSVRAMDAVRLSESFSDTDDTVPATVSASGVSTAALSLSAIDATQSPVVRLVDSTLLDALRSGASDIHMETHASGMCIKYRLDGVLDVVKDIDNLDIAHQAISRVKVMAELDISERRIPQDGRFQVTVDTREIDFRVSIMPNLFGEDAVLRVLDRKHLTGQFKALTLDTLGFDQRVLHFIRDASRIPYGLLLVTGPTGSGKTTTLYAALSEINTGLDKIITIEDPIEYQLAGVLQIPVNEKKGLSFVRGLRSILRHDPDKIMVGEIRDAETAHIAVQAALTGHQVFTTVHANNVFDVIGRFANMGVDSYSLVAALNGIVAQRLLRIICPDCATDCAVSDELLQRSGLNPEQAASAHFKHGLGCVHCRGSGYRGRRAIAETLPMTDTLRAQLVHRAPLNDIRQTARSQGFLSLRDAAIALALSGETTLEEINRVTPIE